MKLQEARRVLHHFFSLHQLLAPFPLVHAVIVWPQDRSTVRTLLDSCNTLHLCSRHWVQLVHYSLLFQALNITDAFGLVDKSV
jgi:hypothetical protein